MIMMTLVMLGLMTLVIVGLISAIKEDGKAGGLLYLIILVDLMIVLISMRSTSYGLLFVLISMIPVAVLTDEVTNNV